MKVSVQFIGMLKLAVQDKTFIDLLPGATYGHLLSELGALFDAQFPDWLWDRKTGRFRKQVLVVGSGRDLHDPETLLKDGEEIKIMVVLAGG